MSDKAFDDSDELASIEVVSSSKSKEVLASLRAFFAEQLDLQVTQVCFQSDTHSKGLTQVALNCGTISWSKFLKPENTSLEYDYSYPIVPTPLCQTQTLQEGV